MGGIQCPAEVVGVVAGDAGFSANGNTQAEGYWRIAADDAITPLLSRRYKDGGVRFELAHVPGQGMGGWQSPSPGYSYYRVDSFGLGRNGDILLGASDVVVRIARDGRVRRVAGEPGQQGFADGSGGSARFKYSGRPVEDDQGSLWLADQGQCAIRKITPDGTVSTLMGPDRRAIPRRCPRKSRSWSPTTCCGMRSAAN